MTKRKCDVCGKEGGEIEVRYHGGDLTESVLGAAAKGSMACWGHAHRSALVAAGKAEPQPAALLARRARAVSTVMRLHRLSGEMTALAGEALDDLAATDASDRSLGYAISFVSNWREMERRVGTYLDVVSEDLFAGPEPRWEAGE